MRFKRRSESRTVTWDTVFGSTDAHNVTASGKRISELGSLKFSVVWRSVSLIADAVASLPPRAFTEDENGQPQPANLPPWIRKPSIDDHITRFDVWHQLLVSVLLWGNSYAQLMRRPSDGAITGMLLLDPTRVNCDWVMDSAGRPTARRRYQIDGGPWLTSADVFHVQGMTLPGKPTGLSVVGQAREAIGLGLTLEEFGARYFGQGSMAKVVIKVPKTLDTDQASALVKTYEKFHKGPGNWHRPAVLSGPVGSDIVNISIPPEDAQFLQTREFQALDVARWFGVPPHRVGIVSKQSSWGSGLAEENTALVQSTYRRYIISMESAFTSYSPGGEDKGIRIRLDDSSLLRGTIKDQVDTWTAAVKGQIATPNEARARIGLPPIEGGDELVVFVAPNSDMPSQQPGDGKADPNATKVADEDPDASISQDAVDEPKSKAKAKAKSK